MNALATFQAHINNALQDYIDKFLILYLDDILIYTESGDEHEHKQQVKMVLECL